MEQSRRHIEVQSEVGRGTTFVIYLPRVEEPVMAARVPADAGRRLRTTARTASARAALASEHSAFVAKPFTPELLTDRVRELLATADCRGVVIATMDRRTFVATLAGGLLATPVAVAPPGAGAAPPGDELPRVGLLRPGAPGDPADRASVGAFLAGLLEAGYNRGKNVRVEVRYAHGKLEGQQALARELIALPADCLVTSNPYATQAGREASRTVPIVVALDYETDPVASGWIASIARPGGNLTGFFLDQPEMTGKLLQLLKEGVPALARVGVLWDETIGRTQFEATQEAARMKGLALKSLGVKRAEDLAEAFATAARERADGLVVLTSPLLSLLRARISELALKHRLPGITLFTNFPTFGLLMAYGPNQPDAFRRSANHYVARILKGARPADLPVQRPEKFELVINLTTAKALGLTMPRSLLVRADQVIQ